MSANSLNYFGLLGSFKGAHSSAAFNTGYDIALVPFGIHCLLTGYLIFRSNFLPRIIGILFALAGLAYLTFVWPPLGDGLPHLRGHGVARNCLARVSAGRSPSASRASAISRW